ncbi:MAG TPA: hypothetical protein ENJ00_10750 [Phycisphaerales bacterium]|nr:hypothetical protein [Phycisphaerales bacterium]
MISSVGPIFDAHLDLAYLAEMGRDMTEPLESLDLAGDPHPPAAVTLPELASAGVSACLGTIFVEASDDPNGRFALVSYPPGDANEAYFKGVEQLNRYHLWRKQGLIRFFSDPEPQESGSESEARANDSKSVPINLGILMECADPIIHPQDLSFWAARGVVAISLSWAVASRYAGGNSTDSGLTALGRELIAEMKRLDIVLDLSHLSQRAVYDVLDYTDMRICASHSNCRSLLGDKNNPGWQRHLDDETISTIAARGGVIGLNLCRNFVRWPMDRSKADRPSIGDAVDHIDHICQLTGSAKHVGIGSDLDGGFSADDLPEGINRASDLHQIFDELADRGYSDADIQGIAFGNWAGFFGI